MVAAPYISRMASAGEKALHAALKKREFDPVYYLYGDDDFLKDISVRELVDAAVDPATRDFNLELRRGAERLHPVAHLGIHRRALVQRAVVGEAVQEPSEVRAGRGRAGRRCGARGTRTRG